MSVAYIKNIAAKKIKHKIDGSVDNFYKDRFYC